MPGLTGKTAHVTGESRGIGKYTAERLARDGARVAVHYSSSKAAAEQTVADIIAQGGSAFPLHGDLSLPHAAEALWTEFDREADGVDILVNNAGVWSTVTLTRSLRKTLISCSPSTSRHRSSSSSTA